MTTRASTVLRISILALVLVAPAAVPAASLPLPVAFSATDAANGTLEWSNAAAPGGAPVQGIGGSTHVLVASTWNDGTYRSFDGGAHWESIPDFPPVTEARVVFDPADPLVGYVYGFGGVARTLDGGESWTHVLDSHVTYRLAISPGGLVLATARDAEQYTVLFLSSDDGDSWTDLGRVGDSRYDNVYGLAFGRSDDEIVVATVGRTWVSHDQGASWSTDREWSFGLARAPDGSLWRVTSQVQRSFDGGLSWSDVSAPAAATPIAVRESDGAFFVNSGDGFHRTVDGGASWTLVGGGDATWGATSLVVDPRDDDAVFTGDEFLGIMRFAPGPDGRFVAEGRTTGLPPASVIAVDGARDGSVLLAGGALGVYASRDGGDSWTHTGAGVGMIGVSAVAASDDGELLVAGGQNRVFQPFVVVSRDGGYSWDTQVLHVGGDGFIKGIAVAGDGSGRLYAAAWMQLAPSSVLESTDGGESWRPILTIPQKVHDVAWDRESNTLLAATEIGVLEYGAPAGGLPAAIDYDALNWRARGATLNTWTVDAEAGRSWSNGPGVSVWSGEGGAPHAPWADTGAYALGLSPEAGGSAVWVASDGGFVARCTVELFAGACVDTGFPALVEDVHVTRDGARVIAASPDGGVYAADI